ncbi:MAG: hypothetical protein GY724_03625 [Actinomycetia bacterium]|nr:hypothetical protein [Actinomycetes bacterium]MCP4222434.1 hypothetical protein [Actinomycetes bacterium]MCP5031579.1 hypothetical protein [Actinomycetes bacterium]
MNLHQRTLATAFASMLALVTISCSESADDAGDLCGVLTPSVVLEIEAGMVEVLADAVLETTEDTGTSCVQRFTAGADWIELTYQDAGDDDTGFENIGETLTTDGLQTSRVDLANRTVEVVAMTSDPAAMSTWDASLVAVFALAQSNQ